MSNKFFKGERFLRRGFALPSYGPDNAMLNLYLDMPLFNEDEHTEQNKQSEDTKNLQNLFVRTLWKRDSFFK